MEVGKAASRDETAVDYHKIQAG